MIAAISLDGRLASHSDLPPDFTSRADKNHLREVLDQHDWLLIGRRSFEISEPILKRRNCIVFTRKVRAAVKIHEGLWHCPLQSRFLEEILAKEQAKNPILLGGGEIYSWFLGQHLVERLILTLEPVLLGRGPLLCELGENILLEKIQTQSLNESGTILLNARIKA